MFNEIEQLLKEIEGCPNIYISQNKEYRFEPLENEKDLEEFCYIKFSIVKRGAHYNDSLIYRASVKENSPEMYLKQIVEDLSKIKKQYLGGV